MDSERIEEFRRLNAPHWARKDYTDEHVHVLMRLSDTKHIKGISIIEHARSIGNDVAFWEFFGEIQLYADAAAPLLAGEYQQKLAAFCRENCKSSLQTAIISIDKIIRQLMDINADYISDDILPPLQMNTDFLRDVYAIVSERKPQQHRKYSKRISDEPAFCLEDITDRALSELDSGRTAAALIKSGINELSIERHLTHIPTNNPSAGHPYFNTHCLVCHRPSANQNKYCALHKVDTNKRKTAHNILNRAFLNLGYTLLHESSIAEKLQSSFINTSNLDLSDREIFESRYRQAITRAEEEMGLTRAALLERKSLFLFGWARKHPTQINFRDQLAGEFDRTRPISDESREDALVRLSNVFLRLSPLHPHFEKVRRKPLLSLNGSPEDLLASVKSTLEIHDDSQLSDEQITASMLRLSCYQIIKMASSKTRDIASVDYDLAFSRHIREFV